VDKADKTNVLRGISAMNVRVRLLLAHVLGREDEPCASPSGRGIREELNKEEQGTYKEGRLPAHQRSK
jgi:hypothetical protein